MVQASMDRSLLIRVSGLGCLYHQHFWYLIHCHWREHCFHWRKNIKLALLLITSIVIDPMRTAPMPMLRCWRVSCTARNVWWIGGLWGLAVTDFCIVVIMRGLLCLNRPQRFL